jgi:hypothetical protein
VRRAHESYPSIVRTARATCSGHLPQSIAYGLSYSCSVRRAHAAHRSIALHVSPALPAPARESIASTNCRVTTLARFSPLDRAHGALHVLDSRLRGNDDSWSIFDFINTPLSNEGRNVGAFVPRLSYLVPHFSSALSTARDTCARCAAGRRFSRRETSGCRDTPSLGYRSPGARALRNSRRPRPFDPGCPR